jgi:hypothetical protein
MAGTQVVYDEVVTQAPWSTLEVGAEGSRRAGRPAGDGRA